MPGLLGTNPPPDDSVASSMTGLMGMLCTSQCTFSFFVIPFPDIGSDNLETCFDIMDAYVVLCLSDADQFMRVRYIANVQITYEHLNYNSLPTLSLSLSLIYIIVLC